MELISLNSSFQPDRLVENYESLIWNERYFKYGDFELKSSDVSRIMELLPRETIVSLRESAVPMVVEDYKIQKNPRGAPLITVVGRSFESVLERRASVNELPSTLPKDIWTIDAAKESDAAYKAIRVVIGDSARTQNSIEILPAIPPAVSELDAIPEVDLVLPADYEDLTTNPYEIKSGDLYSTVIQLLEVNRRGLKATRPIASGSKIALEIYNGANLTDDVVFDARFDQFDDAAYFFSERGSTNVAYVYDSTGSQSVLKTAAAEPSGLGRRVLLVDASSESGDEDVRRTRGLVELYKHNVTALFDGQISQQLADGYNTVYHLGDIIKLTGEYGLSRNVRITEFIRSSDASGTKSFPTLEVVDE